MIDGLRPYPRMKDSGVAWLGTVPEHWGLPRLATVLRERGETNDDGRITDVLSVLKDRGVIPYAEKGNVGNKKSEDITRYKIVRPDDIVVNCMNVIIGSVGLSRYTGCLSPVYYVLTRRAQTHDPRYLNAVFQTKPFQLSLVRIGNGILAHRMRIPMELLKLEPFPLPPKEEQVAIVRFLDHADRRIRRYIRAKQKLIKLLEEQKQAIIHCIVTRGLNPNVRLKPTGLEWLGEVPEHWEVGPLKRFVSRRPGAIKAGPFGSQLTAAEMMGADFKVYTQRNVIDRDLNGGVAYVDHAKFETMRGFEVFPGDVLVTSRGTIGRTALVTGNCRRGILHPCLLRVQPDHGRLLPEFLMALIQDSQLLPQQLTLLSNATTIDVIYSGTLANITVPVPPIHEQRAILQRLLVQTASVTSAGSEAKREISLLREYGTRLIADVVTGKLDVREVAARLPDGAEEAEPPDEADAEIDAEKGVAEALGEVSEESEA